jgi:hypothetical protein
MTDSTSKFGRPTLLSPELIARVRPAVVSAQSMEAIAAELKISRSTLFEWLSRGERPDAPEGDALFVSFALAFREAEAELEQTLLDKVTGEDGKKGEWSRFAWVLERRFQTRWGSKQRIEHTGAEGGAIQIDDARAKFMALLDRHASKGGASEDRREPEPRGD